jgi:hypothetical protein
MKDLQKIKEFFSKSLEENQSQFKKGDKVTYLGHPAEITAVNKEMTGEITYSVAYDKGQGRTKASNINPKSGAIKPLEEAKTGIDMAKKQLDALGVKYEMSKTDKVRPFKVIYRPINKSDKFYDKFEDIVDLFNLKGFVKPSMNENKEEDKKITTDQLLNNPKTLVLDKETSIRGIKFQPGDVVSVQYQFDDDNESFYRIKGYGKDEIKINHLTKKEMDNFLKNTLLKITEAKEEDPVDTITMDIPLFLRMLEYSREDAAEDMDLHDVTEKANLLGKERGILQMDDYDEIVGAVKKDLGENLIERVINRLKNK